MVEAAARAGRIGMTGFNWRFSVAMQRLHAMVEEGALGRIFHVGGRWLGARWADETSAPTWRMDRAQAGTGSMGDMGVHLVDFVRWTFGEFTRVSARAGIAYRDRSAPGVNRPPDAEDFCTVMGDLASGAQVTLTVSRVAHGVNENTLEAYGSRGAVSYRMLREHPRWWSGELRAAGPGAMLQPIPLDPAPAISDRDPMDVIGKALVAPLVTRFLEAIRTGRPASPSFEDGLRAQAVLDAVGESVAHGGWVDVAH
jgi:predicted dehydrogenase